MKTVPVWKTVRAVIVLVIAILAFAALACTAAGAGADTNETAEQPDDTESGETAEPEEEEEPEPEPAPEDESECPFSGVFVSDVSIPDGTEIAPGAAFDKAWRIQNDGCQNWTEGTILIFDHGDRMGAADFVSIPNTLTGNTADVTVSLTAPSDPGTYTGYWQCQSPDGVRFCQVYVEIVVPEPPTPEPTDEPTVEPEPVTVYVNEESSPLTGNVSTGGCSPGVRTGIAPAGNPIRAGVSFDISPYHGKEIISAALLLDDYDIDGSHFIMLTPLNISRIEFADVCHTYDQMGVELLDDIWDSTFLSDPVWVTDAIGAAVNGSSPNQYFQVKIYFGNDLHVSSYTMVEWDSVTLMIEYVP